MHAEHIVKRPILLTEKASRLREDTNQYMFEVAGTANKIQIKRAIEQLFSVKVTSVNTLNQRGKFRRMGRGHGKLPNWKKAIVTLAQGASISFYAETAEETE
ncbi:MAG: 50S ribosomal protein L23 [Deltaproteobacteria bacterium]|nr:50S ribosomal protein L23 [Deltaproteobacteria bacterium]